MNIKRSSNMAWLMAPLVAFLVYRTYQARRRRRRSRKYGRPQSPAPFIPPTPKSSRP